MSLARLVYYSAVFGGWAAFLGWLVAEALVLQGAGTETGILGLALVGALIGAAIGAGLNVAAGLSNANWKRLLLRAVPGLIGGAVGGGIGIVLGNLLYTTIGLPRALGFMVLGLAVGVVDGLYEGSASKIRNGVICGLLGGLVGGLLFDPLAALISSGSGMSSRATAFVILGICIGALVGLAQVVLKDAWLTVLDGYGVGRQYILSQSTTTLGRGDHLPLPFIGPSNAELAPEHLRIVRQTNGNFVLEDTGTSLGTSVRRGSGGYESVRSGFVLADGDVIKLGTNLVRFNERRRRGASADSAGTGPTQPDPNVVKKAPPPPPPPPGGARPAGGLPKAPPARPSAPTPARPSGAAPARPGTGNPPRPPGGPPQPTVKPRNVPPPPPPPPGRKPG